MARVPHPQGPEYGFVYSTPEEALTSGDPPSLVIPLKDFEASLKDPEVQEALAPGRRLSESGVEFMTEVAPNVWVVDPHLVRRAEMHVVEDAESSQP